MKILNLGCGTNKITGATNLDCEESVKPDIVHNFTQSPLPFDDQSFDKVVLFHTIEHIEKKFHKFIFLQINRVLAPDGHLIVSYPEFSKIVQNWLTNFQGKRDFWEATIYGRQLYKSDYHVCAIDSDELKELLEVCGFYDLRFDVEPFDSFNSVARGLCGKPMRTYEEVLYREVCS